MLEWQQQTHTPSEKNRIMHKFKNNRRQIKMMGKPIKIITYENNSENGSGIVSFVCISSFGDKKQPTRTDDNEKYIFLRFQFDSENRKKNIPFELVFFSSSNTYTHIYIYIVCGMYKNLKSQKRVGKSGQFIDFSIWPVEFGSRNYLFPSQKISQWCGKVNKKIKSKWKKNKVWCSCAAQHFGYNSTLNSPLHLNVAEIVTKKEARTLQIK